MIKKTNGSKTYIVSVLKAGWMNYPEHNYKQYLTQKTVNNLTEQLQGLKPILEHINDKKDIYTKQGQQQIIGICVKSYNINEPFVINNKKFRYEDYSSCEVVIDDIEAINKIDKYGYRPSIHFTRDAKLVAEINDEMDYIVYSNGEKCQLTNLKAQNIAFVSDPRYETQVMLTKDNLTDEDKGIINPIFRSQVVNNNYQYNCINSKCMFGNKNVKNSEDDRLIRMENMLNSILAFCEKNNQENAQEETISEEPTLEEVANEMPTEEEKKEEVINQEESASQITISKEDLQTMIQQAVQNFMKSNDVQNMCGEKKDVINQNVLNSKQTIQTNKSVAFASYANPVKEAVMQTPNYSKENKPKTLGSVVLI